MRDYIQEADAPQAREELQWLTPRPEKWVNYTCCPWAKSIIQIDPETEDLLLTPVTCKRWGCLYCARKKIRKLAYLTNGATPNRMLRLGVDPEKWESPEAAWRGTSPQVPELCRILRKERGECEYLRVTELHKSGWPHYHCLIRSSFLPQKRISELWDQLTKAPVVDIRKVDNTFSSFRYLVKYLTKLHKIEWTDRHVSYSRGFFREEDLEKILYPDRDVLERTDEHPWVYLSNRYDAADVGVDTRGNYHLPYRFCGRPRSYTREDCGLDTPKPPQEATNHYQTCLVGLEDYAAESITDQSF